MLTAALNSAGSTHIATKLRVQPLVLIVGTMPRIQHQPDGVLVVPLQRLLPTVTTLPARLSTGEIEAVFDVSRLGATWAITA
jgi:hypothetical protein